MPDLWQATGGEAWSLRPVQVVLGLPEVPRSEGRQERESRGLKLVPGAAPPVRVCAAYAQIRPTRNHRRPAGRVPAAYAGSILPWPAPTSLRDPSNPRTL